MPIAELNDKMGVPLRLPMTPASASSASSIAGRTSATLGGRTPTGRIPLCLLFTRTLPLEVVLVVDVLELLRYPFML